MTHGSGDGPMPPDGRRVDGVPMTVLDLLITDNARAARPLDGRRFARPGTPDPTAPEPRAYRLAELRDCIGRGDYAIDPDAVAGAILVRLSSGATGPG